MAAGVFFPIDSAGYFIFRKDSWHRTVHTLVVCVHKCPTTMPFCRFGFSFVCFSFFFLFLLPVCLSVCLSVCLFFLSFLTSIANRTVGGLVGVYPKGYTSPAGVRTYSVASRSPVLRQPFSCTIIVSLKSGRWPLHTDYSQSDGLSGNEGWVPLPCVKRTKRSPFRSPS